MKRTALTLIISITIYAQAFCQKGVISIGVGPSLGFPVANSNFSYYYKNGVGGSLQANFGVSKLGSITTNITYLSIGAKNLPVTGVGSLKFVKVGYRTSFLNSKFFAGADAGIAPYGSGNSYFVIGGSVGYSFKISKKSYIDFFPTYSKIFRTPGNARWLTVNVLYRLNSKKKSK